MARASDPPPPAAHSGSDIVLRALAGQAEYTACVQLQRDTWGQGYADCVPASILQVSQKVGGVCGGAFAPDGRLIGFVYGLTGVRGGRLIHWSHMLAVVPEYRNHGVGRRLKEYQRDALRALGIEMMYWTFDPLVARNAHLNLNRLGTEVDEYVPDMYGHTGSELHAFGTDRFVVSWPVAAADAAHRGAFSRNGAAGSAPPDATAVRVEIPADVESMATPEAMRWREATRPEFLRLLGGGYRVTGFERNGGRCYYVLTPGAAGATSQ